MNSNGTVTGMAIGMVILLFTLAILVGPGQKPKDISKTEDLKIVLTKADKDWIDTQIGWELEKRGLKVYTVFHWVKDPANDTMMRTQKIGVVIAESREEAECIYEREYRK
jgi:hypothetical protein